MNTVIKQIREMLAKGIKAKDIAKKLKVDVQRVYNTAYKDRKAKAKTVSRGHTPKALNEPVVEGISIASEQQYKNRIEDLEKERRQFIEELRSTDKLCSELIQANLYLLKVVQKNAPSI